MPSITLPTASMRRNTRLSFGRMESMARTLAGWSLIAVGVLGFSVWIAARGEERIDAKFAAARHDARMGDKAVQKAVQRVAAQAATDAADTKTGVLHDKLAAHVKELESQLAEARAEMKSARDHADKCDRRSNDLESQLAEYRRKSYKREVENSLAIQEIRTALKGRNLP